MIKYSQRNVRAAKTVDTPSVEENGGNRRDKENRPEGSDEREDGGREVAVLIAIKMEF